MPDFSTLLCRNHQPSQVSQIIPRSVFRDDNDKNKASNAQKKNVSDTTNGTKPPSSNASGGSPVSGTAQGNASDAATINGSKTNNNGSNGSDNQSSHSNINNSNPLNGINVNHLPKRTFYKLNSKGELVPLPVSKYDKYEKMDIDHHADSSIYILDSAVKQQQQQQQPNHVQQQQQQQQQQFSGGRPAYYRQGRHTS